MHSVEHQVLDIDEDEYAGPSIPGRPSSHARLQPNEIEDPHDLVVKEIGTGGVERGPANASVEEIALGARRVAKLHINDRAGP